MRTHHIVTSYVMPTWFSEYISFPLSMSFHLYSTFISIHTLLLPLGEKDAACETSKGNALSKFGGVFVGIHIYFMFEMVSKVYIVLRFPNFPFSSSLTLILEA